MPKALVLAQSITTNSCNGVDQDGNVVEGGRHWRAGSRVDLSQSDFDYFSRPHHGTMQGTSFGGHIIKGPCVELVVERKAGIAAPVAAPAPDASLDEALPTKDEPVAPAPKQASSKK